MCEHHLSGMPTEDRRECQIPWNEITDDLRTSDMGVANEPGPSARAASALNHSHLCSPFTFLSNKNHKVIKVLCSINIS